MKIGDRIKQRRTELGLSQTKLARLAGVSQALITKLETGKSKSGGTLKILDFAKALQVNPEWLLSGEGSMQESDKLLEGDKVMNQPSLHQAVFSDSDPKTYGVTDEHLDKELEKILTWQTEFWKSASIEQQKMFLRQFARAFPDFLIEVRYGKIEEPYSVKETYNTHGHLQSDHNSSVHEPPTPYNATVK